MTFFEKTNEGRQAVYCCFRESFLCTQNEELDTKLAIRKKDFEALHNDHEALKLEKDDLIAPYKTQVQSFTKQKE